MRKNKTPDLNCLVDASTADRFRSEEFLDRLLNAIGSVWHLSEQNIDLVPIVSDIMECRRSRISIDRLRRLRTIGKHPRDQITRREVFLGLCELCTKDLSGGDMAMVYWFMLHSRQSDYQGFLRLTNSRHNPNYDTRRWAIATLALIAKVEPGRGDARELVRRENWRHGAVRRLRELYRSGAMAKDDLGPELLRLQGVL